MRGVVMYAPGDVRVEDRPEPRILEPTDAIIRLSATCVCGSDLWPYRGIDAARRAAADGPRVRRHRRGGRRGGHRPFGPASSWSGRSSPPTTPARSAGPATRPPACTAQASAPDGAQAERMRVPLADGTLVATPDVPADDLVPSLLAASDVLGTGWFAAVAAEAGPGKTVAVVGDGAVGLLGVLAAKQLGAERIIAMSRHEPRQQLAREFGATDIVTERGDDGVAADQGPDRRARRALGHRGGRHAGVDDAGHPLHPPRRPRRLRRRHPRRRAAPAMDLFFSHVHLHGGPAPVRRFLPDLIDLIWNRQIDPGKVFDLDLPLDQAADGYRAMDERRAIKVLLRP